MLRKQQDLWNCTKIRILKKVMFLRARAGKLPLQLSVSLHEVW